MIDKINVSLVYINILITKMLGNIMIKNEINKAPKTDLTDVFMDVFESILLTKFLYRW